MISCETEYPSIYRSAHHLLFHLYFTMGNDGNESRVSYNLLRSNLITDAFPSGWRARGNGKFPPAEISRRARRDKSRASKGEMFPFVAEYVRYFFVTGGDGIDIRGPAIAAGCT